MSRFALLFALVCLAACVVAPRQAVAKDTKCVAINRQFANIYEYLDPKSNIIKQAKQGESYELVYAGTSWYQVRVKDRVGWLERRAGDVVDSPSRSFLGIPVSVFVVLVVLIVITLIGVAFAVYRQADAEA